MASRTCGWCRRLAHMSPSGGEVAVQEGREGPGERPPLTLMAAFRCNSCGKTNLARITLRGSELDPDMYAEEIFRVLDSFNDRLEWLPLAQPTGRAFADVPVHIAEAATEAHKSREINAYRACLMLARAVIEATAKEMGIRSGSLNSKIEQMAEQRIIREHIKEGAHEIRHFGNDMAHGDFVDPVSAEDADLTLTLMDEVLLEVFQSPARVARARKARLARMGATKESTVRDAPAPAQSTFTGR
ncbi:DUF4145 domain-containing protein [Micromonospora sp. B11E3]|uniref:DUF4145 domain-containing protein n=1 Tax=Micromonospora sp. B11E3 TaxID=3153562 RepID=UPI00325C5EC8